MQRNKKKNNKVLKNHLKIVIIITIRLLITERTIMRTREVVIEIIMKVVIIMT